MIIIMSLNYKGHYNVAIYRDGNWFYYNVMISKTVFFSALCPCLVISVMPWLHVHVSVVVIINTINYHVYLTFMLILCMIHVTHTLLHDQFKRAPDFVVRVVI